MERVWSPGEDSSEAYGAAYEKAAVTISGHGLHPRDLGAYSSPLPPSPTRLPASTKRTTTNGFDDGDDQGDVPSGGLDAALKWARAVVCVLQQSLPWPFRDILLSSELDKRPAHRIHYRYADLLRRQDPKAAAAWFTALVYLNPNDNVGGRFIAPDGPQYPGF